VYEHPSLHLEIAKQRQADFLREARNAQLAAELPRGESETLQVARSVVQKVRETLSRRPAPVPRTQLQASA
jgi:hypothetical protein